VSRTARLIKEHNSCH